MSTNRNLFGQFDKEDLKLVKMMIGKGSEEGMVGATVEANGRRGTKESRRNLRRPDERGISVQRETEVWINDYNVMSIACLTWSRLPSRNVVDPNYKVAVDINV